MITYKTRAVISLTAVMFIFQVFAGVSYPQSSDHENKIINKVQVENNKAISTETILSKIKTTAQDKFSQEVANDDLKRLYATEYFTDVSIDVKDDGTGVIVTFIVEEKSIIEDIVFKGNTAFRAPKLKTTMKSKVNEMLNLAILAQDISDLKALYLKKGYPAVDIKYAVDLDKETNKARIAITIEEKTRVKVSKVNIEGNAAIKTGNIRKILGTKPAWLFNAGVYSEDVLQEDVERIKSLYDDIGYLDVEVSPRLDYGEDGKVLTITFEIKENKQYLVGDISMEGNLIFAEKDIRVNIGMKAGKPFSYKTLRMDAGAIKQYYYEYGYMNMTINADRNLNQATGRIDVKYTIDPKDPVYVGKVEIRGNTKTREIVIRRELRVYPGERFNGKKIKRSKERIYNLGFFESVSFDTEPTETPDIQNLIVNVKESKTGEFSFGGGFSSIDLLIGFVEITQRNFDILNFPTFTGGGQQLSIKVEIGMVRNNYNISWTDPWIFGYPFSFGFDVYRQEHNKRGDIGWAYDETRTGGDLRLGKEFTDNLRGDVIYKLEEVRISDVIDNASKDFKDEEGTNWISSLTVGMDYDTRDNIYNPSGGYLVGASVEDAGGIFFGDKDFVKGTGSASFYHTFLEKFVLELKGRMGLEAAYGDSDEVPIYERFFAGGANTIRGYKERRVGPRDPGSNEPIGGEAIVLGNAEVTFPVFEKIIKGAVFFDVGNVWRRAEDFMMGGGYKSGTGVGVRVKTPIGPVKLDYGFPLTSNFDDDRGGELYFSMTRGF